MVFQAQRWLRGQQRTWWWASATLALIGLSRTAWVVGLVMYSRILATAAGRGPAMAVRTRATISASLDGAAKACSSADQRQIRDSSHFQPKGAFHVSATWKNGDSRRTSGIAQFNRFCAHVCPMVLEAGNRAAVRQP